MSGQRYVRQPRRPSKLPKPIFSARWRAKSLFRNILPISYLNSKILQEFLSLTAIIYLRNQVQKSTIQEVEALTMRTRIYCPYFRAMENALWL